MSSNTTKNINFPTKRQSELIKISLSIMQSHIRSTTMRHRDLNTIHPTSIPNRKIPNRLISRRNFLAGAGKVVINIHHLHLTVHFLHFTITLFVESFTIQKFRFRTDIFLPYGNRGMEEEKGVRSERREFAPQSSR